MNTETTTTAATETRFGVYVIPFGLFKSTHDTREEAEAAAARELNECKIVEVEATPIDKPQEADSEIVETMEGLQIHIDNAYFCDFYEQFTATPVYRVYTDDNRGRVEMWSTRAINQHSETLHAYTQWDEERVYMEETQLWRHDLVILEDTEEVASINDSYRHSDDLWYSYEEEDEEAYTREYHSDGNTYFHRFNEPENREPFYIGYEIEKEDIKVKQSIHINEFEMCAPKWRKEQDGSLCNSSGYELISPCFELCPDQIEEYINKSRMLTQHINAAKSDRCGGHINVSENGKTGRELFESIEGYTPLFHALYYKRIDKGYSRGKSNEQLKDGDKYQSIRIHSNRVEIRIISAVPNVKTLMWRTRLIQYILKHQTSDPREAFINFHDTELKALICEVYNTPEKFATLNERLIRYTRTFEHIDLTDEETQEIAKAKKIDIKKEINTNRETLKNDALTNNHSEEEEEENS